MKYMHVTCHIIAKDNVQFDPIFQFIVKRHSYQTEIQRRVCCSAIAMMDFFFLHNPNALQATHLRF